MRSRSRCSSAGSSGAAAASENSRSSSELSAIFLPPDVTRKRNAVGGGVALVGGQLGHDVVEVPVDDRVRAAQTPQRLQPQLLRPGGDLLVPQALHDELQVGGLHAGGARGVDVRCLAVADRDAPAADLLEHGVDECGLDLEARRVCRELGVERLDGFEDCVAGGPLVEEVEMQVVAVDVRDAGLEARADQRIGVLADGDQEVRAQVGDD